MARTDPEQERKRLLDYYSRQMDGWLEQIATQAAGMTDLAREVLTEELLRRGLEVELLQVARAENVAAPTDPAPEEPPPTEEPSLPGEFDTSSLMTIRAFRDLPEAWLAKGSLASAGIDSFLEDETMVRMEWFWSNLLGGIKLLVGREDAEVSEQILSQSIPENLYVEGVGNYRQPRCPNCLSADVSFEELYKPVAYGSLYLLFFHLVPLIPFPVHRIHRQGWFCRSCSSSWQQDSDEDEATLQGSDL